MATAPLPVIAAFDDDSGRRAALERELARYESTYTVVVDAGAATALARIRALAADGADVALVLADRASDGLTVLDETHALHHDAKRALLLAWGENRVAREDITAALNQGRADYFVVKPTASPDESFHRAVTDFLEEWWRKRGTPFEAVRVVAPQRTARTSEVCDLLERHNFPYGSYTSDSDAGRALLADAGVTTAHEVVVIVDGHAFVDPTNLDVAQAVGARTEPGPGVYDVAVVGAGPAGLAVAVGTASEGLRTALIEPVALGGQAGTSSLIRNYLGFPRGISGAELATRAVDQVMHFGTEFVYGSPATSLTVDDDTRVVGLANGSAVRACTVVIATGVSYRKLAVPELDAFNGVGVFYGAATSEARSLTGKPVYVVGGGNSAGQAAMHLSQFAEHVTILIRGESLAASMSDYLIKTIDTAPNISVRNHVEVVSGRGTQRLEAITLGDRAAGTTEEVPAAALFVLIGAEPFTDWLPDAIVRDDWGYVCTGQNEGSLLLETTMPGVFAVGDVRSGSVKRVASATGEGAMSVCLIHEYLATLH